MHLKRSGGDRPLGNVGGFHHVPGHHADGLRKQRHLQGVLQDVPHHHQLWGERDIAVGCLRPTILPIFLLPVVYIAHRPATFGMAVYCCVARGVRRVWGL